MTAPNKKQLAASTDEPVDDGLGWADALFDAIKHGDAIHQKWLHEALHAWFNGKPIPPVRSAAPAQDAAVAELRKDAERYRWLRDGTHNVWITPGPDDGNVCPGIMGHIADAAIDAALAATTQPVSRKLEVKDGGEK